MGMLSQVTVYERVVSPYAWGTDHSLSLNLTTLWLTKWTSAWVMLFKLLTQFQGVRQGIYSWGGLCSSSTKFNFEMLKFWLSPMTSLAVCHTFTQKGNHVFQSVHKLASFKLHLLPKKDACTWTVTGNKSTPLSLRMYKLYLQSYNILYLYCLKSNVTPGDICDDMCDDVTYNYIIYYIIFQEIMWSKHTLFRRRGRGPGKKNESPCKIFAFRHPLASKGL
jgi:hypothetical protein